MFCSLCKQVLGFFKNLSRKLYVHNPIPHSWNFPFTGIVLWDHIIAGIWRHFVYITAVVFRGGREALLRVYSAAAARCRSRYKLACRDTHAIIWSLDLFWRKKVLTAGYSSSQIFNSNQTILLWTVNVVYCNLDIVQIEIENSMKH